MNENSMKAEETEFIMSGILAVARLLKLGPAHVRAITAGIRRIADDLEHPPTSEDARAASRASWQQLINDLQVNDAEADAKIVAAFNNT